jgi:hypothetical protein
MLYVKALEQTLPFQWVLQALQILLDSKFVCVKLPVDHPRLAKNAQLWGAFTYQKRTLGTNSRLIPVEV